MTEDDTAEVFQFPFKRIEDTNRVLTVVSPYGAKCPHKRFTIDEKLALVECSDCKERLDPIYALKTLAQQEGRYHELHTRYADQMKRLGERSRTKCEHCQKMTRIRLA
jgi:hypothetical protein